MTVTELRRELELLEAEGHGTLPVWTQQIFGSEVDEVNIEPATRATVHRGPIPIVVID